MPKIQLDPLAPRTAFVLGAALSGGDARAAARMLAADTCRGRSHAHHATVTCNGKCCTACGGPIDENEDCRCL